VSLTRVIALADEGGVVQGEVHNGTANGGATAGLAVELRIFQGSNELEPMLTTADAEGRFRFQGLDTSSESNYLLRVTYQEVVYSQGPLSFESGQNEIPAELLVYEPTTSDDGIGVDRAHLFAAISGDALSVTELFVFANPGDRTYIGKGQIQGRRWTSQFLLPKGSHDLIFTDGSLGGRFLKVPDGFVDTEPLWPGRTSVMFSYVLDCKAGDCNLTREMLYPISVLNLLIADTGVRVESDRLTYEGKVTAQGQDYLNYTARNLAVGEHFNVRFQPSGVTPSVRAISGRNRLSLPWIAIVIGAVIAVVVLGYPFWRQRTRR